MNRAFLRTLLLLCALTGFALTADAQTHYEPHISVGARGGMTMSSMSFSPAVKQSMVMGYNLGGVFTYAEERHVGLRAEFGVTTRGWKENFEDFGDQFSYQRRLTYINLPLMTHIFFGGRRIKCLFNLGPEFGFMIANSISSNFDYANASTIPGFPRNRQTEQMSMKVKNRFDYGITGGVGVEYIIDARSSVQLEARYYFGLGNIYSASKKDTFSASRNQTISVGVAYMFRLR